jgi:hypothetical protein
METGWAGNNEHAAPTLFNPFQKHQYINSCTYQFLSNTGSKWIVKTKMEVLHGKKSEIIRTIIMCRNVKDDVCPPFQTRTGSSSGNRAQTHGQVHPLNFLPPFSHFLLLTYVSTKKVFCTDLCSTLTNCTLHCAAHTCYRQPVKLDSVFNITPRTVRATVELAVCHSRSCR